MLLLILRIMNTNQRVPVTYRAPTESIGLTGSPERLVHKIYWDGAEPVVPPELRDVPNLALIQRKPGNIQLESVRAGCKIIHSS